MQLKRYASNPILLPTTNSWENKWVYNCGVTEFEGRVAILYRAQGDDSISRLGLAFSEDGYTISERLSEPVFEPDEDSEYERLGVEDPRISKIGDTYYIAYTAASFYPELDPRADTHSHGNKPWRVRVSLAHTKDFRTFTRHGVVISHIDSKDAALFPELIGGRYMLIHRVFPDIRLAVSDHLPNFRERGPVLSPREDFWDSGRVGIGSPPIKTEYGWLAVYHGTDHRRNRYSLGFILLDLNNPVRVIGRSEKPILEPGEKYEKNGQVTNVVFSCGAIIWKNELLVYYGAGDHVIGVASVSYEEVLNWARERHSQSLTQKVSVAKTPWYKFKLQ